MTCPLPAIRFNDYLVRVDILIKNGNHFQLTEVKAKSYNSIAPEIVGANGNLLSGMRQDLPGEALIVGEDPDVLAITVGGAAAAAYARLQFEDVDEVERPMIWGALLRYCELDTLAMVMIVQAWRGGQLARRFNFSQSIINFM